MLAAQLIQHFCQQVTLPVDVNDVVAYLKANGVEDDIEFIGVDLDPEILQGQIRIFHMRPRPYAEPTRCANIYYHRGHSSDWQRLISCKELIHVLDPEGAYTSEIEEIDELAEKIGLPPEMQDPASDGWATNVDRLAEYRAAAILLPWAAREELLPAFKAGKLTVGDIALMADIPRRYVSFVFGDSWKKVHDLLIGPRD